MSASHSPREDHAVLHQPILEAQLAEGVRTEKAFEARANGGESATGHEGRAQTCAKDEIVAELVESLRIFERGSLRRPLVLHHFESRLERPELEGVLLTF